MTKEEFSLRSTTALTGPEIVGKYFVITTQAITSGDQEQAKGEYKYKKEILYSYDVLLGVKYRLVYEIGRASCRERV